MYGRAQYALATPSTILYPRKDARQILSLDELFQVAAIQPASDLEAAWSRGIGTGILYRRSHGDYLLTPVYV